MSRKKGISSRRLGFESLEAKILLAFSQGITTAEWNEIQRQYPGFDYAGISREKVYVVAESEISVASLNQAIAAAKNSSGADLIVVKSGQSANTIEFTASNTLTIDDSARLTIIAYGPQKLTIDANGKSRIFDVTSKSSVQLANMVLTGGVADNGGAIRNAGTLTMDRSIISDSSASNLGGGIYSTSKLVLVNTVVSGNRAQSHGGGICIVGTNRDDTNVVEHEIIHCTITGNTAGLDSAGQGGGVWFKGMAKLDNVQEPVIFEEELYVRNSIVVNNRAASSEFDSNLYSYFCLYIPEESEEIEGEIFTIEEYFEENEDGVIFGNYNLSTYTDWTHEETNETNTVFDPAKPLFVQDYNFDTQSQGDYTLQESTLSQAIGCGGINFSVYPNGQRVRFDLSGNDRLQDNRIDRGACEYVLPNINLGTNDAGVLTASSLVQGARTEITDIPITNNNAIASGPFTIRLYASTDETISATDLLLSEWTVASVPAETTRFFNTGPITTSQLNAGRTYYLGWIIVSDLENVAAKTSGVCSTPLRLLNESSSPQAVVLNQSSYRVQQGCAFLLTANTEFAAESVSWWWDYGNGYYEEGVRSEWISSDQYTLVAGQHNLRLKVIDTRTNQVIATASAALDVIETQPSLDTRITPLSNRQAVKVNLNYSNPSRASATKWTVNWGDGKSSSVSLLANSINFAHYYASAGTFSIKVQVTDQNGKGAGTWYSIGTHSAPGPQNGLVTMAVEALDMNPQVPIDTIADNTSQVVQSLLEPLAFVFSRDNQDEADSLQSTGTKRYPETQQIASLPERNGVATTPGLPPLEDLVLEDKSFWPYRSDDCDFVNEETLGYYGGPLTGSLLLELLS